MSALAQVMAAAEQAAQEPDWAATEAPGPDGLLRCTVCGGKRQTAVTLLGRRTVVRCDCGCRARRDEARRAEIQALNAQARRRDCFGPGGAGIGWTFDKDNRLHQAVSDTARDYAARFAAHRQAGRGLVFYGPVGTGKSYMAGCICNAVINRGYTARMANLPDIGRGLQETWDKQAYLARLTDCDLLVIDDLGVERKSDYMDEIVFSVVDAWYRSGTPLIVTTNLTSDELSKSSRLAERRVYERILERCRPVAVEGTSQRRQVMVKTWASMRGTEEER